MLKDQVRQRRVARHGHPLDGGWLSGALLSAEGRMLAWHRPEGLERCLHLAAGPGSDDGATNRARCFREVFVVSCTKRNVCCTKVFLTPPQNIGHPPFYYTF